VALDQQYITNAEFQGARSRNSSRRVHSIRNQLSRNHDFNIIMEFFPELTNMLEEIPVTQLLEGHALKTLLI
jgi:hypothetical protein